MSYSSLVPTVLFAAALSVCLFLLIRSVRGSSDGAGRKRLRELARRPEDPPETMAEGESILREQAKGLQARFEQLVLRLPFASSDRMKLQLKRAGVELGPLWFVGLSVGLGVLGLVATAVLLSGWAAGLGLLGGLFPPAFIRWRTKRRRRRFEQDLPEALDLVSRSMRAGNALTSGLRMVGDEMEGPIAEEFKQLGDEISLGLEMEQALENMCERVDSPDLYLFSTAVLIQREAGGNLAEVMEKLAHVIKERFKFYAKVSAMTAMTSGSAAILGCAPLVFVGLMYMTAPSFVKPLWETSEGQMVGMVVGTVALGGYLLAKKTGSVEM